MPEDMNEQLIKYLADVHSIEEQALTQLRRAPGIAGGGELSEAFERHLPETEQQERLVRERLDAHRASPSTAKDLAGKAGGLGMVLFAQANPDTPGKLVNHAYSYEHMELAAYELLGRIAIRAGMGRPRPWQSGSPRRRARWPVASRAASARRWRRRCASRMQTTWAIS